MSLSDGGLADRNRFTKLAFAAACRNPLQSVNHQPITGDCEITTSALAHLKLTKRS